MKKKIVSVCLAAVITVMAVTGASLAYLTDTDEADNVFEVGHVQIQLLEQQRDENGGLEDFENGKPLMPIVGSAQGEKDAYGLPVAKNYVDKIVTVRNTGRSAAYVRVIVAVPAALDSLTSADAPLHWNYGDRFTADGEYTGQVNAAWEDVTLTVPQEAITIDGVEYYNYIFTYNKALAADATTDAAAIVGFYLDESVDNYVNDEGQVVYTFKGEDIDYDLTAGVTVPVFAQAVQAAGFESAQAAFAAAELLADPWAA